MRTYRRIRIAAVATSVLAILFTSSCAAVWQDSTPEQEVVLIGVDLELSGDDAALGMIFHDAMELRVEQLNRQGILGDRRLELTVRDNHSDPGTSAANVADLAADAAVAAVITGGCVPCLLASVDSINDAQLPVISLAAADAVARPVDERRSIFQLAPTTADTASVIGRELTAAGVETVALVATEDEYGSDGLAAMNSVATRADLEVVVEAQLSADSEDLGAVAGEIAEFRPEPEAFVPGTEEQPPGADAVVVWGLAPFGRQVAAGLREAGYEGPLYLDHAAADELFLSGAESAALTGATMVFTETLVIDEVIATSPAKTARKTWVNDYTARYGTYHAAASFAADAIGLVVAAVNQVNSTDRAAIRTALESMQVDGLSGPLRITPENHASLLPQALTTVVARADRWRLGG